MPYLHSCNQSILGFFSCVQSFLLLVKGQAYVQNSCMDEFTIIHLIELDHLDNGLLLLVFQVCSIPPPQSLVIAAIMSNHVRLDNIQDSHSLALIPRHNCQFCTTFEDIINDFRNISIYTPALVVIPGEHKEDLLLMYLKNLHSIPEHPF